MILRAGTIGIDSTSNGGNIFTTDGVVTVNTGATIQTGDLIAVWIGLSASDNRTVVSVVDNNANGLAQGGYIANNPAFLSSAIWVGIATAPVTSVTITLSAGFESPAAVAVAGFTLPDATPIGDDAVANADTTTTHSSGDVTTTAPDAVLLGCCTSTGTSLTADGNFTTVANVDDAFFSCVFAYRLLTSTETRSHVVTAAGNTSSANVLVEAQGASAGGGGDLNALIGEPICGSSVLN